LDIVFIHLIELFHDHRDLHSFPTRRSSDLEWESSVEDFENLLSEIEDKIEIDSPHSFEVIPSLKEETDGPAPQSVVSFEGFNPVPEEGQQSRAPEHSVTTHSSHVVNHWG